MPELKPGLSAEQSVILAVDTSEEPAAARLMDIAHYSGAWVVKLGLELSSATSWGNCSDMAYQHGVAWVADAKIDDIPNTTAATVKNLARLATPPVGITIHTNSGIDSMRAAQEIAGEYGITMLGVTHLTSIDDDETKDTYRYRRNTLVKKRACNAALAGIEGLVCSPRELKVVNKSELTKDMFTMIPGTRSKNASANDQKNTTTPYQAIVAGADLLVVGRQITQSENPELEFETVVEEIQAGMDRIATT